MSDLNVSFVISLIDKVSESLKGIVEGVGEFSDSAMVGEASWDKVGDAGADAMDKVGKSAKTSAAEVGKASKVSDAAYKKTSKAVAETTSYIVKIGDTSYEVGVAGEEAFDKISDAAKKAGKEVENVSKGFKDLIKDAGKLKQIGNSFSTVMSAGTKGMALGGAITAPLVGMGIQAAQSESRRNQIDRAFIGVDGVNKLDAYDGLIKETANAAGRTKLDIRDAVAGGLLNGMTGDVLRGGGLDAIVDFAVANKINERTTAEHLARVGREFNAGNGDYGQIANYLNNAALTGGMEATSLMSVVAGLGDTAKKFHFDDTRGLQGIALLVTQLKNSGMSEGEAGNALGELFGKSSQFGQKTMAGSSIFAQDVQKILKDSGVGDITNRLFNKKGELHGADGAEKMANFTKVFEDIVTKVKSAQDKAKVLKVLLGDTAGEVAAKLTREGWNATAEAIKDHISLEEQAQKAREETIEQFDRMKNRTLELVVAIGSNLLPVANNLLEKVANITGQITDWADRHPILAKGITLAAVAGGLLVTGVFALVFGVGLLGKTITNTIVGFDAWKGHLISARTRVMRLGNSAIWANAKLKLLQFKGGYANTLRDFKFGNIFKGIWGGMKKPFTGNFWGGMWDGLKSGGAKAWHGVTTGGSKAMLGMRMMGGKVFSIGTWKGIGGGLLKGLGGAFTGLGGIFKGALLFPLKALGGVVAAVGWPVLAVIAAIAVAALLIYKYWEPIKAYFEGIWEGLKAGWTEYAAPAFEELKIAAGGIWDIFCGILDLFIPIKAGQDGVNDAMSAGAKVGVALSIALKWVFKAATWVLMGVEGVVGIVLTLVDVIVAAGKTIWYALSNQWDKIGDTWGGVSDKFWDRLENSTAAKLAARADAAEPAEQKSAGEVAAKAAENGMANINARALEKEKNKKEKSDAAAQAGQGNLILAQAREKSLNQNVSINYNPQITLNGSATAEDESRFSALLKKHQEEITNFVNEVNGKRGRWAMT